MPICASMGQRVRWTRSRRQQTLQRRGDARECRRTKRSERDWSKIFFWKRTRVLVITFKGRHWRASFVSSLQNLNDFVCVALERLSASMAVIKAQTSDRNEQFNYFRRGARPEEAPPPAPPPGSDSAYLTAAEGEKVSYWSALGTYFY